MRLPQFSSILYSDFPSNKPSSYWLLGYLHFMETPMYIPVYTYIYRECVCQGKHGRRVIKLSHHFWESWYWPVLVPIDYVTITM